MKLDIGDVLTNQELMDKFGVANSGGMRRSIQNNVLLLIHNTLDSIYRDHWEGKTLHYTGMGLIGDQNIDRTQNKTLANSKVNGIRAMLFEVHHPKQYTYAGDVCLSSEPYYEDQLDKAGQQRKVVVFPLQLVNNESN